MRDETRRPEQKDEGKAAPSKRLKRNVRIVGFGALIVVAALVGFGAWGHAQRRMAALETLEQQEDEVPTVRVSRVVSTDAPRVLDLPGSMEAVDWATVYVRATGYISTRNVDTGSKVHAGDILAVIAAPDLGQQLDASINRLCLSDRVGLIGFRARFCLTRTPRGTLPGANGGVSGAMPARCGAGRASV